MPCFKTPSTRALRGLCAAALILSLAAAATPAHAGPWVKAPGEVYAKLSAGAFEGTGLMDLDGSEIEDPEFQYSNTSFVLYAETGIAPDFGITMALPLLLSTNELSPQERASNNGLGDLELSLQYQVRRRPDEPCPVAASLFVRVPLYEGVIGGETPGTVAGQDFGNGPEARLRQFIPALGDGSIDVAPMLSAGCGFRFVPGWFSLEAGPLFRTEGFGHGFRYAGDLGVFVWPERLGLSVRVDGQERWSQQNDRPTKRFASFSGGAFLRLWEGFSLEASGAWVPGGGVFGQRLQFSRGSELQRSRLCRSIQLGR